MRFASATSVEMRTPAVASALMHALVVAVAILGLPSFFFPPPMVEPEPVMVEFEAIAKKAAAPLAGNPPPQPKEAKPDKEATKAPPPKTADPPPAPPTPKPPEPLVQQPPPAPAEKPKPQPPKADDSIALKPKEPEPAKVEPKPEPPKPTPPQVVKKPDPPKPPPPKPKPPDKVDALLDDILKNKDSTQNIKTAEQQPKPQPNVTRAPQAAPNLAAVVTASEIEGVRQKIRPCWNFPAGVRGQDALVVTLVVQMNQDGTPTVAEVRDTGRYNNDPAYRAAADAAHRAIMNPRCQPWPLAQEKFNSWKTITFNFDPRDY